MSAETPFLEAIRADPHDVAARLVYADWLEERGDPRGELIRIEEEMRPLPVFSDRFWELKPRRHELLQTLRKDWLEAMRYGTDCPPTFAHVPNGWKEWWRLIRVFTERWDSCLRIPHLADVGGNIAQVEATEFRLGRRLPDSLREWVAFAHEFASLNTDTLGVLGREYVMENRTELAAVIFSTVKGLDQFWAIHHSDFNIDDPPVYRYYGAGSPMLIGDQKGPISPALTSFVLGEELFCLEGRDTGGINVQQQDAMEVIRRAPEIFPVQFELGDKEIFERNNVVAIVDHTPGVAPLWVSFFRKLPEHELPHELQDLHAQAWNKDY
jgi:uncharacterized protein (TIGR02996 family)